MTFAAFYFLALIPLVVGGLLWWFDRRYTVWEWALNSAVAFIVAGIMHWSVAAGMTADEEVWSGEITRVEYRPEWRERYKEAIYRTETYRTGVGKNRRTHTRRVFSHYETRHATHPDRWTAFSNIDLSLSISRAKYDELVRKLGAQVQSRRGDRSTMKTGSTHVGGDPNDYFVQNTSRYVEPVIKGVAFENRVKASPSVFSYAPLTPEEANRLPDYPGAADSWRSNRVFASPIDTYKWDQMMGRLGPHKMVNLIIARMPSPAEARKLEAKWVGGKKNDLVLTYGDGWSYVFGWTEQARVKRELETLLITKPVTDAILSDIDRIVRAHYKPVGWHKFDYLDLKPRAKHVWLLVVIMVLTQAGAICLGLFNGADKKTVQ